MAEGLTPALLMAGVALGVISFLVLQRIVSAPVALVLVVVKFAIPIAYFAWTRDGTWNFLDDVTYWRHGRMLLARGYDPFTVLFRRDGLAFLAFLALGPHILFSWWNHLAQFIFGPFYYSAVLLNVALTFVGAILLHRLVRTCGFDRRYASALCVFYLLHWELLAWTSFINLKDVLVGVLTLAGFSFMLRAADPSRSRAARLTSAAGVLAVLLVLPMLRFYVPVLLLGTLIVWLLLKRRGWNRYVGLGVAAAGLLFVLPQTIPSDLLEFHPRTVAENFLRVVLTPQPWSVDPAYSFLVIPSVLHWVMLVPAVIGGVTLWRTSPRASLVVLYLFVVMSFYAVIPEIITPRNRIQVVFIWAWIQFHAVYVLLAAFAAKTNRWATRVHGAAPRLEAV